MDEKEEQVLLAIMFTKGLSYGEWYEIVENEIKKDAFIKIIKKFEKEKVVIKHKRIYKFNVNKKTSDGHKLIRSMLGISEKKMKKIEEHKEPFKQGFKIINTLMIAHKLFVIKKILNDVKEKKAETIERVKLIKIIEKRVLEIIARLSLISIIETDKMMKVLRKKWLDEATTSIVN